MSVKSGRLVVLLLAGLMLGGGFCSKKKPSPPTKPVDYSTPDFVVTLHKPNDLPYEITGEDLAWNAERMCECFNARWRENTGGKAKPPMMPTGRVHVRAEILRQSSTSAEAGGDGVYGAKIYAWSKTTNSYKSRQFVIAAWLHRLGFHVIPRMGNESHCPPAGSPGCRADDWRCRARCKCVEGR